MFNQYSYKKKCVALLGIFVILSITAYKRSFSTLIAMISEHKTLSKKIVDLNKKTNNRDKLTKEIAYLDKITGKAGTTKEMVQQGIVSFVSEKHSKVSINELKSIHIFYDTNYTLITNQLDVTGGVNQLMELAYDFEKNFSFSRIVSMNFYSIKKNNITEVLHLKMIFQNYESNK